MTDTTVTDAHLLRLARRFHDAGSYVQGFLYEPDHVIRDLRKSPGEQEIWRGRSAVAFDDQLQIEYMRFALEDQNVR